MFEILGYLKEREERHLKHIHRVIESFSDFSDKNYLKAENTAVIIPPDRRAALHYLKNNTVILNFESPHLPGLLSLKKFERALSSLADLKEAYVELNLYCSDFDFELRRKEIISVNRGIFNSYVKGSTIFTDESTGASYYTHPGHLVWIHDVKSVSLRHNLVKRAGFKGIFIRDVKMAADGNWDSLCGMMKAGNAKH